MFWITIVTLRFLALVAGCYYEFNLYLRCYFCLFEYTTEHKTALLGWSWSYLNNCINCPNFPKVGVKLQFSSQAKQLFYLAAGVKDLQELSYDVIDYLSRFQRDLPKQLKDNRPTYLMQDEFSLYDEFVRTSKFINLFSLKLA